MIVKPPLYVPARTDTVSPLLAAPSAGAIAVKLHPDAHTVHVVAAPVVPESTSTKTERAPAKPTSR